MNYKIVRYEHAPGDFRQEIRAETGDAWILHTSMGGSGYEIRCLAKGESWQEGADELHGVFDTREEAEAAWNRL